MKRGTILLIIGLAILAFTAMAVYYVGQVNFPVIALGVAGLIVAGVGASRRWERASR